MTRQQLPNLVGISGATAGAKHLSMNLVARKDPNEQESVVAYDPTRMP
jgi:hypothetical protein